MSYNLYLRYLFVGSLTALVGCDRQQLRSTEPSEPMHTVARLERAAFRSGEPDLAELARLIPEAGGYYLDESGDYRLLVTEPGAQESKTRFLSLLDAGIIPFSRNARRVVKLEHADFTLGQLAQARNIMSDLWDNQRAGSINSLDLNEQKNRVEIVVDPGFSPNEVLRAAKDAGLDTAMLEIRIASRLSLAYSDTIVAQRSDTLVGGQSIGIGTPSLQKECTLGYVGVSSSITYAISASHCTWTTFAVTYDNLYQHSTSSWQVGTESIDPTGTTCATFVCRSADAAAFTLSGSRPSRLGLVVRPSSSNAGHWSGGIGTNTISPSNPYWAVGGTSWVASGYRIEKMGIATRWTWGTVIGTCVDFLLGGVNKATCQTSTTAFADHGDSGGPVFMRHEDPWISAVGITVGKHGGDRSVYSPISAVLSNLGGTWNISRSSISTPTLSASLAGVQPFLSWSAISGATSYRVLRQWYRYPSETGSSGWEDMGPITTTSWGDPSLVAEAYTGGVMPNFSTEGYVAYQLWAEGDYVRSGNTPIVYFRLAPP